MPYVSAKAREPLREPLRALTAALVENEGSEGELNYAITTLLTNWVYHEGVSYRSLNAAVGVLECAKQELYRRMASPYEDVKLAVNGDVY